MRVVSRSLSASSTATLVHAFIVTVNRLDHCSSLYCSLPQVRLQPLDGVLRAAARMIGGVRSQVLDISVNSCEILSAGSLSGSAFTIGSPPLFGVVSLALRLLTYWNLLF